MDVGERFTGLEATTEPFVLVGGLYELAATMNDATEVALETRAPEGGDNWLPLPSLQIEVVEGDGGTLDMTLAADGVRIGYLATGEYRLAIEFSSGDGADVVLARIL